MPGGADWEDEIEQKLRACDIFILLVSRHSLSSDYVVDKEIPIIRERQAKGEAIEFYPLVLTPTPKIALDLVRDKNLRPREGKPFSDYSVNERYRHMNEAADEIARLSENLMARRAQQSETPKPPRAPVPRQRAASGPAAVAQEQAASDDALTGSPLDLRLTFATFRVGPSNKLAFSAAQRVAENLGGSASAFRPLYIHSAGGLGKTHLLQAVAHAAAQQGRSVIYLTAQKFTSDFVAALQSQSATAFKERLRTVDLLIFDDAQFLKGKNIQAEFGHCLNTLLDAGRDVIVAGDRPPNDLESLDERVRSRLNVGLCVEIGALDEPLRLKILEARVTAARAEDPHFEVSPPVLFFSPALFARTVAIWKARSIACGRNAR